jgi:hypothetical protein
MVALTKEAVGGVDVSKPVSIIYLIDAQLQGGGNFK